MVSQLQKSKKDLETYVAQLDGQLDDLENKIEDLKEEITAKKTEIEETKADIEQAQAVADQQYEDMKTRLRYLYRNSKGNGYLELLVNAGSFADMLNQAGYVEQLSSYDSRKLEEYRQSVEYLELCKQTLEEEEGRFSNNRTGEPGKGAAGGQYADFRERAADCGISG